jgi:hypothetical protein
MAELKWIRNVLTMAGLPTQLRVFVQVEWKKAELDQHVGDGRKHCKETD